MRPATSATLHRQLVADDRRRDAGGLGQDRRLRGEFVPGGARCGIFPCGRRCCGRTSPRTTWSGTPGWRRILPRNGVLLPPGGAGGVFRRKLGAALCAQQFGYGLLPPSASCRFRGPTARPRLAGTVLRRAYPQRENFDPGRGVVAPGRPARRGGALLAAARSFRPRSPPARQTWPTIEGVTFWNDSKATNFHAVEAALATVSRRPCSSSGAASCQGRGPGCLRAPHRPAGRSMPS
jgi:hypothetical protein